MKYLYKYPQAAYPYADLVETNRGRTRKEFEYELLDTRPPSDCAWHRRSLSPQPL